MAVVKDKIAPWPAKAYYLLSNYKFVVKIMRSMDDWKRYLNPEVAGFLDNPHMQLYRLTDLAVKNFNEDDPYLDLKAISHSSFSDPFQSPGIRDIPSPGAPSKMDAIEVESMLSFNSIGKRSCKQRLFVSEEGDIREEAKDNEMFEQD